MVVMKMVVMKMAIRCHQAFNLKEGGGAGVLSGFYCEMRVIVGPAPWGQDLKKGRTFMLMAFCEYQLPFQFIQTTPSSVPCLAMCRV